MDIIGRDISNEDNMRRILALEFEYRNAEVCDMVLNVDDGPAHAAEQLMAYIG